MQSTPTLAQIETWARHAGQMLRAGLNERHTIDLKGEINLVTEMDHRSEAYLLGEVRRKFPDHTIISEEAGLLSGLDSHCWYIDPLDGTVNYAHGLPLFCVSIGYAEHGQALLGAIYDPMLDEMFSAESGRGAMLNGQPIHASAATELNHSLLVTGFPYDIRERPDNNLKEYSRLALRSHGVRRLGSAALDLGHIAAGRFDGFWELRLSPWDTAAGWLIVTEAGGSVSDIHGNPFQIGVPHGIIASAAGIHDELVAALNE